MTTYNTILSDDIKTTTTVLNQLIDFVEEDISGSATRKKYQVFVTGAAGDGGGATNSLTSSLFHTIFDQDYSLQTANELFDLTVGLHTSSIAILSSSTAMDINGKLLFQSRSIMMREKHNIYKQFAQNLLGNPDSVFTAPFSGFRASQVIQGSAKTLPDNITEGLFFTFKRLFVRDGIKRETFAMRLFSTASSANVGSMPFAEQNLISNAVHPATGAFILTDVGSAASIERSSVGGDVGNLVLASDTSRTMGLIFYQQGIVVLDMNKVFDLNQVMSGTLDCVGAVPKEFNATGSFLPNIIASASIDNLLDHITTTRFGSGSNTFLTFQNNTQINSTLVFCRAYADHLNYSSNPTYTDSDGRIVVIDESQNQTQKSFTFVTTVGLYSDDLDLIAVAKLSRPVEKNDEKDLTFRVRLDF